MATPLCPRALSLRSVNRSTKPLLSPLATKAAFSSVVPLRQANTVQQTTRRAIVCRKPPRHVTSRAMTVRKASTTAEAPPDVLTWNRFFDLRKKRRYVNLVASVATAGATVSVAGPMMASADIDTWGAQLTGMDPVFVLGLSTLAVAGVGWLCGPSFGSGAFGMWISRRGWGKAYQVVCVLLAHQACVRRTY